MTASTSALLRVVDSLYSAATLDGASDASDVAWRAAVTELGAVCGAPDSMVLAFVRGKLGFLRSYLVGLDESSANAYKAHYAALDPVLEPAITTSPTGTLLFSDALLDRATYFRSEFHNDWINAKGWSSGAAVQLLDSGSSRAVLYMARGRHAGAFSIEETESLRVLVPHVQRAAQLSFRLAAERANARSMSELQQASCGALIVVDKLGTPVYANRAAESLLRNADVLSVEPRHIGSPGAVRGPSSAATQRLRALISAACKTDALCGRSIANNVLSHDSSGGSVLLRGLGGTVALLVLVSPLPIAAQQHASAFHNLLPNENEARAVLSIVDLASPSNCAHAHSAMLACLATHFGLTTAEAEVAVEMAGGTGLAAVAARRRVTLATVRTQAASIYQKLNVRGQTELASFTTRLSERLAALTR